MIIPTRRPLDPDRLIEIRMALKVAILNMDVKIVIANSLTFSVEWTSRRTEQSK